jgi:hypothetical protein
LRARRKEVELAQKTPAFFDVDMAQRQPIVEMHGNPGVPEGRNHADRIACRMKSRE